MSAQTSGDVCNINDEEVLRKMWEDAEDFGKKKEIRSHMYKLREERLRNFYNSSDSGTEIRTTQHSSSLKEGNGPTHADSLIDQGFMSLKSKEIRDSESPTKDMHHFRITETNRGGNQGWDVVSKNEVSQDGKTHTSMKVATTSGTEKIDKGVANYSAQCEQKASVYQDGDDNNFTKSATTSSSSALRQEAKGGDDNSSFHSSSTSTSSSSKTVSQHRTASDRTTSDRKPISSTDNQELVVRKTYTTDVPVELKRNPNYIDGNTTVTTETRTLPDGTKVTTTRYETKGVSSKISQQNFHSTTNSTKKVNDTQSHQSLRQEITNVDQRYVPDGGSQKPFDSPNSTQIKGVRTSTDEEVTTNRIVQNQINKKQTHDNVDDVYITKIINEKEYNPRDQPGTTKVVPSGNDFIRSRTENIEGKTVTNVKTTKVTQDDHYITQKNQNITTKPALERPESNEGYPREQISRMTPQEDVPRGVKPTDRPTTLTPSVQTTTTVHTKKEFFVDDIQKSPVCKPQIPQEREILTPTSGTPGDRYPQEYLPNDRKPSVQTTTTVHTKKEFYVDDLKSDIQKSPVCKPQTPQARVSLTPTSGTPGDRYPQEYLPNDRKPSVQTTTTVHTKKEFYVDDLTGDIPKSPVCKPQIPQEREILTPASGTPGDRYPQEYLPNDRKPGVGTPGDRTPANYRPQEKIPPAQEITLKPTPVQYSTSKPESNQDNVIIERTITTTKEKFPVGTTIVVKPQSEKITTVTSQTTYKTDYTAKRISVDISPTHDAFARSLRASPDRDRKRGSLRSLKSSTSSLRSSTSPEKAYPYNKHPETTSLDRKQPSRISPSKNKPDSRESSPIKKVDRNGTYPYDRSPKKPSSDTKTSTVTRRHNTDVHTKESRTTYDTNTITRQNRGRPRSRSVSPTTSASDIEFIKKDIVTDLDDDSPERRRPSQTTPKHKKVNDGLIPQSPTKKYPENAEKPFKRRDTYEERCRQILGINQEDITQTTNRTSPKKPQQVEDRKSPEKKPGQKIQEYPSQVRRTSEKVDSTKVSEIEHKTVKKDTPGKPKENTAPHKPSDGTRKTPEKGKRPQELGHHVTRQTEEYHITQKTVDRVTKPGEKPTVPKGQPKDGRPVKHFPSDSEETCETEIRIRATTKPGDTPQKFSPTTQEKQPKDDSKPGSRKPFDRSPEKYGDTEITEEYRTQETVIRGRVSTKPGDMPKKVSPQVRESPDDSKPKTRKPIDYSPEKYPGDRETTEETVIRNRVTTRTGDTPKRVLPTSPDSKKGQPKDGRPVDQVPENYPSDTEVTDEHYTQETIIRNRITGNKPDDTPQFPSTPRGKQPVNDTKLKIREPIDRSPEKHFVDTQTTEERLKQETVITGREIKRPGDTPNKCLPTLQGKQPTNDKGGSPVRQAPEHYPSDTEETDEHYNEETVIRTRVTTKPGNAPKEMPFTPQRTEPIDNLKPKSQRPIDYPSKKYPETEDEHYTRETVVTDRVTTKPGDIPRKVLPTSRGKQPLSDKDQPKDGRPVDLEPEHYPSDTDETDERYTQETVIQTRVSTKPADQPKKYSPSSPGKQPTDERRKPIDHSPKKYPDQERYKQETVIRDSGDEPRGNRPIDQEFVMHPSDTEEIEEHHTQETVIRNRVTTKSVDTPKKLTPTTQGKQPTDDFKPQNRTPQYPDHTETTDEVYTQETLVQDRVSTKPGDAPKKVFPTSKGKQPIADKRQPTDSRPIDRDFKERPDDTDETDEHYTQETIIQTCVTTKPEKFVPTSQQKQPINDFKPESRKPSKYPVDTTTTRDTYTEETVVQDRVTTKTGDKPKKVVPTSQGHPKGGRPVDRAPKEYPDNTQEIDEHGEQETLIRTRVTTKQTDTPTKGSPTSHLRQPIDDRKKPIDRSPDKYSDHTETTEECYTQDTLVRDRVTKPGYAPNKVLPTPQGRQPTPDKRRSKDDQPTGRRTEEYPSDTEETDQRYIQETTIRVTTKPGDTPKRSLTPSQGKQPSDSKPESRRPMDRSPEKYHDDTEITETDLYTKETVLRDRVTTKSDHTPGFPLQQDRKQPKKAHPVDRTSKEYPSDKEEIEERYSQETTIRHRGTTSNNTPKELGQHPKDDDVNPKRGKPEKRPDSYTTVDRKATTRETIDRTNISIKSKNKHRPGQERVRDDLKPKSHKSSDQSPVDSSDEEPIDQCSDEPIHIIRQTDDYYLSQTIGDTQDDKPTPTKLSPTHLAKRPKEILPLDGFDQEPESPSDKEDIDESCTREEVIRRTSKFSRTVDEPHKTSPRQPTKCPVDEQSKPGHRKPVNQPSYRTTKETDEVNILNQPKSRGSKPAEHHITHKTAIVKKTAEKPTGTTPTARGKRPGVDEFVPETQRPDRDEHYTQQRTVRTRVTTKHDDKPKKPSMQPVKQLSDSKPKGRIPIDQQPEISSRVTQKTDKYYVTQATVDRTHVISKSSDKPKSRKYSTSPDKYPSDRDERDECSIQETLIKTRRITQPDEKRLGPKPDKQKPTQYHSEGTHYITSNRTVVTDRKDTSRKIVPAQEPKPKKRIPNEETNEVIKKSLVKASPEKRPQIEEPVKVRNTYLTTDKLTVHRRNKLAPEQEPETKKRFKSTPDRRKPNATKETAYESPEEDYPSGEDECIPKDDFYTLNIKVYRNDLNTGMENGVDEERNKPKHTIKPEPRNRIKTDKDTVYRTEEKHFVNKTVRKSGKIDSSDRDSPVKQIGKSQRPATVPIKGRDTKTKPDATRHVVTTTIQVVPKKKAPQTKEPMTKSPSKISKAIPKDKSHLPSDVDDEFVDEEYIVEEDEEQANRSFNRQITHTVKPKSNIPTSTDTSKRTGKVITTKSIVINNNLEQGKEFIVNLQRSTSSREATPDRSYAYPASDNEDKGIPRYPDEVCEPDDPNKRKMPTKLSDIPIIESEDYPSGILHKVDESDHCLLTVNQKVNKFVNEADKLTRPKSNKPLNTDFYKTNTTDRLNVTQQTVDRPKSPKCQNHSDDENEYTSVSQKVSHFIETAEKIKSQRTSQKQKVSRPEFTDVDDNIRSDDCLLSVSDKVTKFTTAVGRKSPNYKLPVSLAKMDSPRSSPAVTTECVQIDNEEDMYVRKSSPKRRPSGPDTTPKSSRKDSEPKQKPSESDATTPKSSRKDSEPRTVLSPTSRLRSTESIRRAKEIFESTAKDQTPTKPRRPYESKTKVEDELKSTRLIIDKINRSHSPGTEDIPGYMRPLNRNSRPRSPYRERSLSPQDQSPQDRSRSPSIEKSHKLHDSALDNIPHYMWPLDRSVHSPDRDTSRESSPLHTKPLDRQIHTKSPMPSDASEKRTRKIDSERSTVTTKRHSFTTVEIEDILTVNEIEEIYDIEILEVLLEWAVSYEQRRRVRSQIRIVKQLIIDHKLPKVLFKKPSRSSSPKYKETALVRKPSSTTHEERTVHSYSERKHSTEVKSYSREISPETKIIRKTPERKPQSKEIFKPELKRVETVSKKIVEEKPSWVTQRPLKKPSGDVPKTKPVSSTKKQESRVSPSKERKPTDAITSSYGVGPTDENGSPLFGLKALRAQTQTGTTKVQGTVIKSHYYSENGHEPTGEISVTKYSNDPNDFDGEGDETEGLVSVTTTKRFGKGSPDHKAIADCEYYPEDEKIEECENRKSSVTSVTRRGSVKQMSKKFIENAVETSKTERQSSYPKAGLILRTSSFKKTSPDDRESSPEGTTAISSTTVRKTTSTTSGTRGDTFLSNQTRVRDVQDVITRMKNSDDDVQEGDTPDDVEARKLLNKFIGSQVILSGMETLSSSPTSSSTIRRTTTTTTTTSKGGGKPTVVTRTFTHPITQEDLDTVWDEPTLKLLLERSTEYEERRIIRGRLRDIMAEKEVCADVIPTSTQESSGRVEEFVEKTEGPVTTTQVTTRVTSQQISKKPMSPFAKFRQLDKQNSLNTPPGTPKTPKGSTPLFKFTDPELNRQASTVKERLLQWCQMKTKEYENVQLDNFSSSWADGLAFCALIHHFKPDAFDYHALTPKERRHNFTLAFRIADEKADIVPLLDVEDMIATRKPDWKCVFTYVQTIYARFKNED